MTSEKVSVQFDHQYCSERESCQACIDKNTVIFSMANEIAKLNEKENLKAHMDQLCEAVSKTKLMHKSRKCFSATAITSDSKMKFYTGIQSLAVFEALFSLLKPHAPSSCFGEEEKSFHQ